MGADGATKTEVSSMNRYLMAADPYAALEQIYAEHGVDYGLVYLENVALTVWRYREVI
jgi:hypothetical protein